MLTNAYSRCHSLTLAAPYPGFSAVVDPPPRGGVQSKAAAEAFFQSSIARATDMFDTTADNMTGAAVRSGQLVVARKQWGAGSRGQLCSTNAHLPYLRRLPAARRLLAELAVFPPSSLVRCLCAGRRHCHLPQRGVIEQRRRRQGGLTGRVAP